MLIRLKKPSTRVNNAKRQAKDLTKRGLTGPIACFWTALFFHFKLDHAKEAT